MAELQLISSDSHVSEPPDLWVERLDIKYRDRAPSTWPHSRDIIARDFKDVSEVEKRKIVRENAAQLYGFDLG